MLRDEVVQYRKGEKVAGGQVRDWWFEKHYYAICDMQP